MGTRAKFQGATALSFAVWVVEMKWFFDVAIQEITPLFEPEVFGELLKNWTVQTQVLCPSKFGLPYSRPRKYSVLMRSGLRLTRDFSESGPEFQLRSSQSLRII